MSKPIIEEWESNSEDDEIMVKPKEVTKTIKPSFEKIESVNARNETVRKNNKISTAQSRKTMNDAMPTTYSYYKAYSSFKRPFNKKTANYNRYFNKRVNTVKSTKVNTARPKAEVNTVKASSSWVWKPKRKELDHVFKSNSASKTLTRYDYVDALGSVVGFVILMLLQQINNNDEDTAGIVFNRYGRKEHFILPRGRISTAGYEVSIVSFILSTAYEYLVSAAAYPDYDSVLRMATIKEKEKFKCKRHREFKNHLSDNEESLDEDASRQGRIDDADAEDTFIDETSNDARNKNNKISNIN
ncbi:hypothetical protein Tco_0839722 [Tanacetum coccineum]|uniref:Uncharacterized protein n=1 Tax=Tanacetum coccineum TaxID=301880 RepID=A0ABQ5ARG6_9ASTR